MTNTTRSSPQNPPDNRTLDLFLGELMGSESDGANGRRRTTGRQTAKSGSPAASRTTTGRANQVGEGGCLASPVIRQESQSKTLKDLSELLAEMAGDIDFTANIGHAVPYTGDDLRAHYDCALKEHGIETVAADAEARYRLQVVCTTAAELPPLTFPCEALTMSALPSSDAALKESGDDRP